jgi:3-hydroxyacyl-CoA dehydrogenase
MKRILPQVDIVKDVLQAARSAKPASSFIASLEKQYMERGSLSKKQLQGLYQAAKNIPTLEAVKLATLEAIILRMHTRNRSEKPAGTPLYQKDESTGNKIHQLLEKYSRHKQVIWLKEKFDNNEILTSSELTDLERLHRILLKGS